MELMASDTSALLCLLMQHVSTAPRANPVRHAAAPARSSYIFSGTRCAVVSSLWQYRRPSSMAYGASSRLVPLTSTRSLVSWLIVP
ncbi:hypothetical protein M404DRAFT_1005857, partial [Pisolithus tinctorius Marx 270]